jgi:hypothetical protein
MNVEDNFDFLRLSLNHGEIKSGIKQLQNANLRSLGSDVGRFNLQPADALLYNPAGTTFSVKLNYKI